MNVHLFMDPIGHYCSIFAERADRIDPANNIIVNINRAPNKFDGIIEFNGYDHHFKNWMYSQKNIKRIYYHYYNPIFQEVNARLKGQDPKIISVWCFWGGDFFALPEFLKDKYLSFSSAFLQKKLVDRSNRFRDFFARLSHRIKGEAHYNFKSYIASFTSIDYFAGYFYDDFLIVKQYSNSSFKFHKFPYLSLDVILGESRFDLGFYNSNSIMVGHSADPGLNHYEVLQILSEKKCVAEVYLALTYGNDYYKAQLVKAAKKFHLNITIQDKMLSLEEYNLKQRSFGFAIFNVNHQQAFGNIISLIWFGVKVFLHENSSIYKEFKNLGFNIYNISNLHDGDAFEPLTPEQKNTNRILLNKILSAEISDEMNLQLLRLN
jgi:dTDP-N-acetylfucosamine:lipid II N-acetylfucosaminyltransferase